MRSRSFFQQKHQGKESNGAVLPAAQTRFYLAQMVAQKGEVERSGSLLRELPSQFQGRVFQSSHFFVLINREGRITIATCSLNRVDGWYLLFPDKLMGG